MTKFRDLTRWQRKEIIATFKSARKVISKPELDIRLAPALFSYGKILIITPKKVGSAPQRNLVRRRLKMIFYQEKLFEKGFDWIIFVKPQAVTASFTDLQALLHEALRASAGLVSSR